MAECKRCGACCRVWGIYEVTASDMARVPERLRKRCSLYPGCHMMRTRGFACAALRARGCSIYEDRPAVCRRFRPGSELCRMAREQDKTAG
jgi:Fe-S-cluster containining protein